MKNQSKNRHLIIAASITSALAPLVSFAGTSANSTSTPARNDTTPGTHNPAITISFSGQTALRAFSAGAAFTYLTPGTSITLNNGPGGAPITYTASNTGSTRVQLASANFTLGDTGVDYISGVPDIQRHSALRSEWHEQGSGDGLLDLINDQVGFAGGAGGTTISNLAARGPSSANPTWVNSNQFTAGNTLNGFTLSGTNFANTYDATIYNRATGQNIQNGQDRVQFSVGEYKTESLAAAAGTPNAFATAGGSGYGQGNPALKSTAAIDGLGFKGGRQQLRSASIANLATTTIDPQSTSNANYVAGPWNTAGSGNIDSKQIAVTAVPFTANPGTGLSRLNLGDTQWLETQGRLQNGADFNVVTRTANTGQRVVAALNTGVDPSWAVGENDDGNTSGTAAATAQRSIGPGIRFSGKTSGTEARNAIAQSRMGFGPLSLAETRGAASAAPVRALDVDFTDQTDPTSGGVTDTSKFVHLNYDSIVNFAYKTVLISHYNTVKQARPDLLASYQTSFQTANGRAPTDAEQVAWWSSLSSDVTGIKGDVTGAVQAVIKNVTNSTGTAAAGITTATVSNPADGLFINGFTIPQLLNYTRQTDGGALTPQSLTSQQLAQQADIKANYGAAFSPDGSSGSSTQTIGSNATYGALGTSEAVLGSVPITNNNYLFGNFNQDGRRDYSSVKESVNAALSLRAAERAANISGADSSLYRGLTNATVISSLGNTSGWASSANTKGDLIVLGDYNSDGAFDGKDIYALSRGASLSTVGGGDHLTGTFADAVRDPNAKLNKNAALDYAQSATASGVDGQFLRTTARATLTAGALPSGATQISTNSDGSVNFTFDPTGTNAFNKFDVNRDGKVTRDDAAVVDAFVGKNYHSLTDQLGAVVRTDKNAGGTPFANGLVPLDPTNAANDAIPRRAISLVDVELDDNAAITAKLAGGTSDFKLIQNALGASLVSGDADFSGNVNFDDLIVVAQNYNKTVDRWSQGDFTLDGIVNFDDLIPLAQNYNTSAPGGLGSVNSAAFASDWAFAQSLVPEPTAIFSLLLTGGLFARTRRVVR